MQWFREIRKLSNVRRCGTMRMIRAQNVAEHSYYAATLAMQFMRELDSPEWEFDRLEVLEKVLLHDAEESLTTDIPYPFKRFSPQLAAEMRKASCSLVQKFFPYWLAHRNVNAKEGLGAEIVIAVDYIELYAYCMEEKELGNCDRYLDEILRECEKILMKQFTSQIKFEAAVGTLAISYINSIKNAFENPSPTDLNGRVING